MEDYRRPVGLREWWTMGSAVSKAVLDETESDVDSETRKVTRNGGDRVAEAAHRETLNRRWVAERGQGGCGDEALSHLTLGAFSL